ncbi:MAG: hypothetical protein AUJ92_13545 [Armatimonadetes bacterium CG2_30_59_28]|nr:hypothetical protein [Armatimonadota bacterium]OIO92732.1 MAG: hypothetical protein AUJ92_13545 [Armatimonadetes bacterium CG2_30_59_28]PIU66796.1 MAG: hypothetical protein COS85_03270 [Armatimonadetes bacterium CG07_land_8_20_14_0_80_59_28]PIX41522.1 MAG: hypothetical protein COZ56_11875 [Armatimonadetes bacterium CG_4_8_14_3_um_filter_58_9]PIY47857.1 MAG: hypothetical protein COZ05_04440 [Armatimonadetes bacterium CG_4_10_14_3_um_filter_59_10]PJB62982.1 MAG: hypothetical protein CO095_173
MPILPPFEVDYDDEAIEDVRQIAAPERDRIKKRIEWLATNLDALNLERLKDPRFHGCSN